MPAPVQPRAERWHWLRRRADGAMRLGFWDRCGAGWRVADSVGRTAILGATELAEGFEVAAVIAAPVHRRRRPLPAGRSA